MLATHPARAALADTGDARSRCLQLVAAADDQSWQPPLVTGLGLTEFGVDLGLANEHPAQFRQQQANRDEHPDTI